MIGTIREVDFTTFLPDPREAIFFKIWVTTASRYGLVASVTSSPLKLRGFLGRSFHLR